MMRSTSARIVSLPRPPPPLPRAIKEVARSFSTPVGLPSLSRSIVPPGGSAVSFVMFDSFSASELATP